MKIKLLSPKLGIITHTISIDGSSQSGPKWSFNGNNELPTFSPSIKVDWGTTPPKMCHYFIQDGEIRFCSDSTHSLAGKVVLLPDIPEEWR